MDALKRSYSFSDGHLSLISTQIMFAIGRDLTDFDGFGGMTATTITDLDTLTTNFNDIPTDEYYEGLKMVKTEQKDEARALLNTKISEMMALVGLKYGKASARYRHFGITAITAQTDEQIQRSCANVIRCATLYLLDLASVGVTQARIDELETLKANLILGLDEQGFAIRDRDIATENRISAGNTLYDALIGFMNVGKAFWKSRNEAKYNDYVMYDEKGKPQDDTEELTKVADTTADAATTTTVDSENDTP
jgi:hypothetical protein